ncbi:8-oxoguanine glycosylase OGG1 [Aspergillus saccharolyticus JOP 1030-1]|uniref:DNA-(apurinic or apyrimidinic site) lyase n=1 Tax=Aspergillus saccharolyticus JOP 1030-1 TaxID=1450539 RepID=A0A318ZMF0_9EURO|nr:DNA N-glycosylase [Aspergillus saccharolyticus JOP 1030-1]PYH48801.1 DNA N-glycosylase [Aspergillus saccharolyticus JOP 1030-1]
MTVGAFSEWRKLPVSLSELCINTTLRCGQSFRWHNVSDSDEWRCVLHGRLVSLKQDPTYLYYRTYLPFQPPKTISPLQPPSPRQQTTNGRNSLHHLRNISDDTSAATAAIDTDPILPLLTAYFNLPANLTNLYEGWSKHDANFRKKAPQFTGIRILRQDAWEALIGFICSSNNNISRITQMVEKICLRYGPFVASVDGRAYHDFPSPEALVAETDDEDVEATLRGLGFGYRAKYICQTARIVALEREKGWLEGLRNPESVALGSVAVGEGSPVNNSDSGEEWKEEGREGYRLAHAKLLELQGVGPKVADCVCLMGLGWGEAVPVDTHVWQIAQRDYKFGKGSNKSLNKVLYDAVGNHFRKLWGKEAGWAQSVLFTANLRSFSDRLAATSSNVGVKVEVKEEEDEGVEVKTEVTTATTIPVKRAGSENGVEIKAEDEKDTHAVLQASQTTTTRRMSKRLRKR